MGDSLLGGPTEGPSTQQTSGLMEGSTNRLKGDLSDEPLTDRLSDGLLDGPTHSKC